ncbi:hypothetical protein FTW19_24040 [Terriglobus albidus]|uniref:Uncharacterized protein n=1 Tax=Terriglobus albidus TaxID=1592106 RepID=A0A5B9EIW0_9BACT|nr:hypothetical protein FTW19_24040 [Terriglobus albidus]
MLGASKTSAYNFVILSVSEGPAFSAVPIQRGEKTAALALRSNHGVEALHPPPHLFLLSFRSDSGEIRFSANALPSAAEAAFCSSLYGTAEAVPLSKAFAPSVRNGCALRNGRLSKAANRSMLFPGTSSSSAQLNPATTA